jgi:hypothetical protein
MFGNRLQDAGRLVHNERWYTSHPLIIHMLTHISPKCDFIFSFWLFGILGKNSPKKKGFLIQGSPFYLKGGCLLRVDHQTPARLQFSVHNLFMKFIELTQDQKFR